jgi:hypothetical protein
VTGPGGNSPALELNRILSKALERLAVLEGLTVQEVAFSREVIVAYAKLEAEQTRGGEAWQIEEAISGRR